MKNSVSRERKIIKYSYNFVKKKSCLKSPHKFRIQSQNFHEKIWTFGEKNTKFRFFSQYKELKPIQNALMEMFCLHNVQPVTEEFIWN